MFDNIFPADLQGLLSVGLWLDLPTVFSCHLHAKVMVSGYCCSSLQAGLDPGTSSSVCTLIRHEPCSYSSLLAASMPQFPIMLVPGLTHAQHEQRGSTAPSMPEEAESTFHASWLDPNWIQVHVLAWTCQEACPHTWLSLETYGIVQAVLPSHMIISAPCIGPFGLTRSGGPTKSQQQ